MPLSFFRINRCARRRNPSAKAVALPAGVLQRLSDSPNCRRFLYGSTPQTAAASSIAIID